MSDSGERRKSGEDIRLVLIGPPASGKGTQAVLLREAYGVETISTGAMLRAEMAAETELGMEAARHLDRGQLLPDDLMLGVVKRWLGVREGGFLLDGFPRTRRQAEVFDEVLAEREWELTAAIFLDTPEAILEDRVTKRMHCESCGAIVRVGVHVESAGGACPKCGGDLVKREDDTVAVFRERMEEYREKTVPVLGYYEETKKLVRIRGEGGADVVFKQISDGLAAV
ncbi:MAG: nucleoside monophosphate kinase [Verrucomicrobiota bacterium]